jgi:hypothetical protein
MTIMHIIPLLSISLVVNQLKECPRMMFFFKYIVDKILIRNMAQKCL